MPWGDRWCAGLGEHDQFVRLCVEQLPGATLSYSTLEFPIITLVRHICDQQVEVSVIRRIRDSAIQIFRYNDYIQALVAIKEVNK